GAVDVAVTNPDSQSATLSAAFSYQAPPPPTVSGISPNAGSTAGGTAVTIFGSGFLSEATVSIGGGAATNVVVGNASTITATTGPHAVGAADVSVQNPDGQSNTLAGGFTYAQASETALLADNFNNNSLDTTKWQTGSLFSGFTDATVAVTDMNQRLEIGPLQQGASGSHYNGVVSRQRYDFTNAYAYVAVIQTAAAATAGDAMLTLGQDANNYYRIYEESSVLFIQKRLAGGAKVTMWSGTYDNTAQRYWRIRHDATAGNVVFETAADN